MCSDVFQRATFATEGIRFGRNHPTGGPTMRTRRSLTFLLPTTGALAALTLATSPLSGAALPWYAAAVKHVYAAGHNPRETDQAPDLANPLGVDNANNNVSNFLKYAAQAKALPAVDTNLHWQPKGPDGIDQPPGYSQS